MKVGLNVILMEPFTRMEAGSGATGAVLRDHHGRFKGGSARWYDTCMDALTMEALACRDGLSLAVKSGATSVLLETDCQELVRLWSMKDEQRSSVISGAELG